MDHILAVRQEAARMVVTWADGALAMMLVAALPLSALFESLRTRSRPPGSRLARYGRAILIAAALAVWLGVDWRRGNRPLSALGLAWPPSAAGWVGLGLAALILGGFAIAMTLQLRAGKGGEPADVALLPQTPAETAVFGLFCLVVCGAWELLYRGYLLWFLAPSIGLPAAVGVAAAAYGVAHGYRTPRQFVGSLVSALLFTAAYALTGSLWWLILIHVGLPALGVAAARARSGEQQDALPASG